MKTSILLVFYWCLFAPGAMANMASPINEGTLGASPFISRHVDILSENIRIVPDKQFETARFHVEYHLRAHKSGKQIPLLFYAPEYREGFIILLDGKPVKIRSVSDAYPNLETTHLTDFRNLFEMPEGDDLLYLSDSPTTSFSFEITELIFFEIDLSEGEHTVQIEYTANPWVDHGGWVKEYSFRYALSPAKYWKSFGTLTVDLEVPPPPVTVWTNFGKPEPGNLASVITWSFDSIPVDVMLFTYKPETPAFARALIAISPEGMTLISFLLLAALHAWLVYRFRKKHNDSRFSWIVPLGSLVVPFLSMLGFVFSYELIDWAIGPAAGQTHGYIFLVFMLYPFVMPFYWLFMGLYDWSKKPAKGTVEV